ncbi:hypothetical protein SACS_0786 [Parasaccharibacter apium]|uniref:Uncharacterized protein n=1 Tax=Parasaccharibacter apium TaxID=1510841 RepID=A0A7U7G5M7_9PROT|nr:hypothetical protein SACS_0786 [Parasaccharibacter apium]
MAACRCPKRRSRPEGLFSPGQTPYPNMKERVEEHGSSTRSFIYRHNMPGTPG